MQGKEHMIVGTTATATMGVCLVMTNSLSDIIYLVPLVIGGFIGSYMPDVDSKHSKITRFFNKLLVISIIALLLGYNLGLSINVNSTLDYIMKNIHNHLPVLAFCITIILGKFSPHRMFTHKWLGTFTFCYTVYLMGNDYFTMGFVLGYILHILCDRFTSSGKKLKFFEFKLPCKNSKNKTTVVW